MAHSVTIQFVGRWGNQLFEYAFARGYAEKLGLELHTPQWIGQTVFEIDDPLPEGEMPPRAEVESEKWMGEGNIEIRGYCMRQQSLIYRREDVRRWFKIRPEIQAILDAIHIYDTVAHLRHGDFLGLDGFVAVSRESFYTACRKFGINSDRLVFVSEETALRLPELELKSVGFFPDFYRLMKASILLRSNSSFSWWAATLGHAERIFSPDLTGVSGGSEPVDAPFVEGNWPSISHHHSFCSDLHLS